MQWRTGRRKACDVSLFMFRDGEKWLDPRRNVSPVNIVTDMLISKQNWLTTASAIQNELTKEGSCRKAQDEDHKGLIVNSPREVISKL